MKVNARIWKLALGLVQIHAAFFEFGMTGPQRKGNKGVEVLIWSEELQIMKKALISIIVHCTVLVE